MTRTMARQMAVQLSFAAAAGSDMSTDGFFEEEYFHALPAEDTIFTEIPDENAKEYIRTIVNGVAERREELDELISRYSRGWKVGRISKTALAVLRVALFEILYVQDVPPAAAINEAVEQAKGFDEPETVSFINGILGSFMREQTPAEQPTDE